MDLGDYHSVRNFLAHAFGQNYSTVIEAGVIADLISEKLSEDVGTTIKTEGPESDPFGFVSIVPLRGTEPKAEGMLKNFLRKTCAEKKIKEQIQAIVDGKKTGIVFMERFVNLPADIASPIYSQLLDDYKHAVSEDKTFKVEQIFLSTPTFLEVESELDVELQKAGGNKGKKFKKSAQSPASHQETNYYYGESELLEKYADFCWDYKVDTPERMSDSKRAFGDLGVIAGRRFFCLSMEKFALFVKSIDAFIK